jgi:hypothetical protein
MNGRGQVATAHLVFKTSTAWQPHAWKVRFLRRSAGAAELSSLALARGSATARAELTPLSAWIRRRAAARRAER